MSRADATAVADRTVPVGATARSRLPVVAALVSLGAGGVALRTRFTGEPIGLGGVVIEVRGDLSSVEEFAILTTGGDRVTFTPADGVLFDDRAPLTHLRDHLRSGEAVVVEFDRQLDEPHTAVRIVDAGR